MLDYIPGTQKTAPLVDYIPPGKTVEDVLHSMKAAEDKIMKESGSEEAEVKKGNMMFAKSLIRAGGGGAVLVCDAPIPATEMLKSDKYVDVLKEQEGGNE